MEFSSFHRKNKITLHAVKASDRVFKMLDTIIIQKVMMMMMMVMMTDDDDDDDEVFQ